MRRERSKAVALTLIVIGLLGLASSASAANFLGGRAAIREWGSEPPLKASISLSSQEPPGTWIYPGNPVFRYLNAAAGPIGGKYRKYGRYSWTADGVRTFGADAWSIATTTTARAITLRITAGKGYAYQM
jgi:hypothetical protein